MDDDAEQNAIDRLFRGLAGTFLEGQLILGGSSGLFGFSTNAPAYTEDLDFYLSEEIVVSQGTEIVQLLADLGYERHPETPTFSAAGRSSFDLVGYSTTNTSDHLSPPGPLQVMVFGDLGVILECPSSVIRDPTGRTVLSPAGFAAIKLLTIRVEKGAKDKLQALLVIAERPDDAQFRVNLSELLSRFGNDTCTDALADAQVAFLSIRNDPSFQDQGAEHYASFIDDLESGYRALVELVRELPDG